MALIKIPQNVGKVKVAMGLGGKWTVWNGKQGKHEFVLFARDRKHAEQLVAVINGRNHGGFVEVTG